MRTIRKLTLLSVALLLTVFMSVQVFAATIYQQDGYSYTDMEEANLISLCGWDNRSTDLVVPDSIGRYYFGEIANYGLQENTGFTSLDMTQATNLRRIGLYAFYCCEGISGEVIVPFRVKEIGMSAFERCSGIESLKLYASVKTIPTQMCYSCSALSKLELPSNLERIENLAFANCGSLTKVTIPRTVSYISPSAFSNDTKLSLRVYNNSYAMQYAIDHGFDYDVIDPLKGDFDGDGFVTVNDATYIQMNDVGMSLSFTVDKHALKRGEVTGDGEVDVRDATMIQMKLANMISSFD